MQAGGLPPLLELLESKQGNLQHNAAFALYGLADNKDNIPEIVRQNGVSRLHEAELLVQVTWACRVCSWAELGLQFGPACKLPV